jgi:hypothetical protein
MDFWLVSRGDMSNPFNSKEFKKELSHWNKRLEKDGFKDTENPKLPLRIVPKAPHQDLILTFFLNLDWLMTHYESMPKFDRKVMEAYSSGKSIKDIAQASKCSYCHARNVIKRYKGLVIALIKMTTHSDLPPTLRLASLRVPEVIESEEDRIFNKTA